MPKFWPVWLEGPKVRESPAPRSKLLDDRATSQKDFWGKFGVFKRSGVARAVLQNALSLID